MVAETADGRPHYSTEVGGHLFYSTDGRWLFNVSFSKHLIRLFCCYSTKIARKNNNLDSFKQI